MRGGALRLALVGCYSFLIHVGAAAFSFALPDLSALVSLTLAQTKKKEKEEGHGGHGKFLLRTYAAARTAPFPLSTNCTHN